MGLQDFATVFSRSFVVGFFIPAFLAALGVDQLTTENFMPEAYRNAGGGAQIAVLGGAGVVLGILLSGLNHPILRLFEGYKMRDARWLDWTRKRKIGTWRRWLARRRARFDVLGQLRKARIGRWQRRFDALQEILDYEKPSDRRTKAAHELNQRFPAKRESVLPTRLGNALRSAETHPRKRYGLDGIATWPRIEMLLSDAERQTLEDLQATVNFFVNTCVAILVTGTVLMIDASVNTGTNSEFVVRALLTAASGLILFSLFYMWAVGAVVRWGTAIRASFDLHRFELLQRLGLKTPETEAEEREIARRINRGVLFAEPFPDECRQEPDPQGGP